MQEKNKVWDKVKIVLISILATLGVLFIIIMLIPTDDEDEGETETAEVSQEADFEEYDPDEAAVDQDDSEIITSLPVDDESSEPEEEETQTADAGTDAAEVNIPASDLSNGVLSFTTTTLDEKKVDQSIFNDYDITIVHVWGTFCGPCIEEMGEYADLYDSLPSNVNLVGIVCDVYDGINNNVSAANDILSDAGAGFMNLRTSDSVYDLIGSLQYVPSSFFVDREGHIVGSVMDGAGFDETLSVLDSYVE